ncbi:hypothetical protein FF100_06250 [Methylobacterium terricola]|uniref:Peptidase inhibitor family I36 n=1 Tax=Methylobacterium terricola TaxID=2583531 RepID=A0A5C4LMR6_9HYPH|nr:hypothetical protein [Methylobacterium terricola]TNC15158.1 hypothetical protein FF100_06250 [Methylobacterium terricola]
MRAFHRAGLWVAGLVVLAGAACLAGPGRAVAQSDLEMPADPPVLSKPYRSSIPIYRRRPPPDAVPPEAVPPAGTWREPPGRIGAGPDGTGARETPPDSGFGPVKAAPARDVAPHDLAPDDEPEERSAAPSRAAAPPPKPETQQRGTRQEARPAFRPEPRAEREPRPREAEGDADDAAPAYAGVWGPSAAACASRRSARRGFLPAVIRPGSARAGKTLCQFRDTRREGRSWVMTAACHSAARRWTSRVRLTVAGNSLTWASERGAATYTRCSGG